MQIIAAVARGPNEPFRLEKIEIDPPSPGEVLVRIVAVGLCHTDLLFRDTPALASFPAVFGHEGAGIVEAVGEGISRYAPGDRVAISFSSCGSCTRCNTHLPCYCDQMPNLNYLGRRIDGTTALHKGDEVVASHFFGQSSFASHAITRERNLVRVPDDIPMELAAPLGCGIQTGAGAVMQSLACEAGSTILIIGGGSVGLSAVLAAVVQDCTAIIVSEPHAARRALALELGATHVVDPGTVSDLTAHIRSLVPIGVDYVLDTVGRPDGLSAAFSSLRAHGVLGLVSPGSGDPDQPLPGSLVAAIGSGIKVQGIIEGDSDPALFLPQIFDLFRQGRFPLDKIVRTFPFSRINEAFDAQHRGECVKPVLLLDQLEPYSSATSVEMRFFHAEAPGG